jgi:hypothetical protein
LAGFFWGARGAVRDDVFAEALRGMVFSFVVIGKSAVRKLYAKNIAPFVNMASSAAQATSCKNKKRFCKRLVNITDGNFYNRSVSATCASPGTSPCLGESFSTVRKG